MGRIVSASSGSCPIRIIIRVIRHIRDIRNIRLYWFVITSLGIVITRFTFLTIIRAYVSKGAIRVDIQVITNCGC